MDFGTLTPRLPASWSGWSKRPRQVQHRTSRDKNTRIAQDHRSIKQRYYPMRGFGTFDSVARCCPAFEEQRHYSRAVVRSGEAVTLANRRGLFQDRWAAVMAEFAA